MNLSCVYLLLYVVRLLCTCIMILNFSKIILVLVSNFTTEKLIEAHISNEGIYQELFSQRPHV